MHVRLTIAALLFAFSGARPGSALDSTKALTQYPQDAWRTDDGLPQNNVHAIARDGAGYLWLGTESGLARFDGARFVPYLNTNTPGLLNNSVWTMISGRRGDLWIGTEGGLTHRADGTFTTYTTQHGLPRNVLHSIHEDPQGVVWAGTAGGLARFNGTKFVAVEGAGAPVGERIRALTTTRDGALWVGTERGLFRRHGDRWQRYTIRDGLPLDIVYALLEDRDGNLWFGTYGGGVGVYRDGAFTTYGLAHGLAHLFVYTILQDRDGTLWFGTEAGLSRRRDGRFQTITPKEGLAHDRIWTLHEDAEGTIWLGTRGGGGLLRLKDGTFTTFGPLEGLLGGNMYGAYEDRDGNVWAAMLGAGIARLGRDGTVLNFTDKDGLVQPNRMWTVYVDRSGTVWAGGDQGLFRLRGGRFVLVPGILKVRGLLEDRAGTLWIGTAGEGLGALHPGAPLRILRAADGMPNDAPTALYEDAEGTLWAGTWGDGIARLRDGKVVGTYTMKDGLASDSVKVITQDRDGALWFGTTGGLTRLRDGKLTTFSMKDGLHDDVLFQIFEDDQGFFWLGSTRGVFRVRRQDLEARARGEITTVQTTVYGTGDGLRVGACTGLGSPAGFRGSDGRLWFTTPNGLSFVRPAPPRDASWKPPLLIEDILVQGQPVAAADGVRLPAGTRSIQIRYTALSYRAPERVHFKVWLEGVDEGWQDTGTRRAAFYTNLAPGSYRFKVAARTNDGQWAETETALVFAVEPLFYQTRWFLAIVVVAIAGAVFGAHRWRIRHLRAREKVLARRTEEAVSQLKLLRGLLPICASCKKIRDDKGYWNQLESYIGAHSQAEFSHSICPECMLRLYPEYTVNRRVGEKP
jgi:ligand-binding sensor domain-containing protein